MDDIGPGDCETISRVYRLYPNATQRKLMEHFLDGCRSTYNHLLEYVRSYLAEGGFKPSIWDLQHMATVYRNEHPEFLDIHCSCTRETAYRIHRAMEKFIACKEEGKPNDLPRFKSFRRYHSFTYETPSGFRFKKGRLRLGKIGLIRYRNDTHPDGSMQMCTVKRDAVGRWYATIYYRVPKKVSGDERLDNMRHPVGVDLGLANLAVTSDGDVYENPKYYQAKEALIARLQRSIAFMERDGLDTERKRRRLYRTESRVKRQRKAHCRLVARGIVKDSSVVFMEMLEVNRMIERDDHGHNLNKQFRDASMGILKRMINCKAEGAGIKVVEVNPMYTSRMCSVCGYIHQDLRLKEREIRCPICDTVIDRDYNAARNILKKGLDMETFRKENGRASPDNIPIVL